MSMTKGRCPQCNCKVMLRTEAGEWFAKKTLVQVDLVYADKSRVRVYMCAKCAENPNKNNVIDAITCNNSQAGSCSLKQQIKDKGYPEGFEIVRK